jgi:polyisoprenoid-binding protein YceI
MFTSRFLHAGLALAALATPAIAADSWTIDPVHSSVVFHVSHMNVATFWGRFVGEEGKMGTLTIDADASKNAIELMLPAESIDTHDKNRDKHLRGPDFFDASQFPELSFKSSSWKKIDDKKSEVSGNLTMHGVTKPVTVTVTKVGEGKGMKGEMRTGYDTSFTIKRSDFGMNFMVDNGGVGDEVTIFISVEAVKK